MVSSVNPGSQFRASTRHKFATLCLLPGSLRTREKRKTKAFMGKSSFCTGSCIILLVLLACGSPVLVHAQVEPEVPSAPPSFAKDTWHISVSPYLWMAGLDADLNIAGHQAAVHQSFADIFSNTKFGFTGLTEVRRGHMGLLTDLIYIRMGEQKAIPVAHLPSNLPLQLGSTTFTLVPEFAYRVYADKHYSVDALAGLRYYHLSANIDVNPGNTPSRSYSNGDNWADAVAGARFRLHITPKMGAFLIADAGGGGSSPTWQIATGIGYKLKARATAQLGYRRLYFNRNGGSALSTEATQQGLLLGITWRLR